MSKYLVFESTSHGKVYIFNKRHKTFLGFIEYYHPWKQYIFQSAMDCVFSFECLQDILNKVNECNKINKENIQKRKGGHNQRL